MTSTDLEFAKEDVVSETTFIHQVENGTIFHRSCTSLRVQHNGQKKKATMVGGHNYSIMAAQEDYVYYGSNYYRNIFRAKLEASGEIEVSPVRYMNGSEDLHLSGMIAEATHEAIFVYRMCDDNVNDRVRVDIPREELKLLELKGMLGDIVILREITQKKIEPSVEKIGRNGIVLRCYRGEPRRSMEWLNRRDDIEEYNSPWGSPTIVKCTYVYMTNGRSLFVIDPVKVDKEQPTCESVEPKVDSPMQNNIAGQIYESRFLKEFEVEKFLGAGNFGCVFRATNKTDGETYAVKRVAMKENTEMAEVRTMCKLKHPGIVQYYGSWTEEPPIGWQHASDVEIVKKIGGSTKNLANYTVNSVFLYIQMEVEDKFCKQSLFDWLKDNQSPVSRVPSRMRAWFKQLIEAVNYIHQKNIFHRDIKPDNIMFLEDDILKLCDLGLATERKEDGESKSAYTRIVEGTPRYMSPEQQSGEKYGSQTDVFSLGLILAELRIVMTGDERTRIFDNYRNGVQCELIEDAQTADFIKMLTQKDQYSRPSCKEMLEHDYLS